MALAAYLQLPPAPAQVPYIRVLAATAAGRAHLRRLRDAGAPVLTKPADVSPVADKISAAGYKLLSAQVEMLPQNGYIKLTNEDDIKNMQKMLDMFEDNDDVQNVWHNWEDAE